MAEMPLDMGRWITNASYILLAAVTLRLHVRLRTAPAAWLAATFGAIAAVVVADVVTTDLLGWGPELNLFRRLTLIVLLAVPYLLSRFVRAGPTSAVDDGSQRRWLIAAGALAAWTLVVDLPVPGAPATAVSLAYSAAFLALFTGQILDVARRLWTAGPTTATLGRRRMRLMAAGCVLLSVSLVAQGAVGASGLGAVFVRLVGLVAAGAFVIGFVPPTTLRRAWREREILRFHDTVLEVMTAEDEAALLETAVPLLADVVGARAVLVVDEDGGALARHVVAADEIGALEHVLSDAEHTVLRVPMGDLALVVVTDPFAPYFGEDEEALVHRLAMVISLGVSRARLLSREQAMRAESEQLTEELARANTDLAAVNARIADANAELAGANAQLHAANDGLERANEDLRVLAGAASHDLRNPLTSLIGYAHTIERLAGPELDDRSRLFLTRITANARYMDQLIDQVLDLTQIGREADVTTAAVDLAQLASSLRAEFEGQSGSRLAVKVAPMPAVALDPLHARRLLTNLFENARKYGGDDVAVSVRATGFDEHAVTIEVVDTGPGIPEGLLPSIFDPFERAGARGPGVGLGLAICRRIVSHAGGVIEAVPHEGGACFRITLPRAHVAVAEVASALAPGAA